MLTSNTAKNSDEHGFSIAIVGIIIAAILAGASGYVVYTMNPLFRKTSQDVTKTTSYKGADKPIPSVPAEAPIVSSPKINANTGAKDKEMLPATEEVFIPPPSQQPKKDIVSPAPKPHEESRVAWYPSASFQRKIKPIILVVDQSIYSAIESEVSVFKQDLESDLKTSVKVISRQWNTANEVKNALTAEKQGNDFSGVILIGNIPWPLVRTVEITKKVTPAEWLEPPAPDDNWYINFGETGHEFVERNDASCTNETCAGIFFDSKVLSRITPHNWTGELSRWVGRIKAPFWKENIAVFIASYLRRNHAYRTGQKTYRGGLIYAPDATLNPCQGNACVARARDRFGEIFFLPRGENLDVLVPQSKEGGTKANYLNITRTSYRYQGITAHGTMTSFVTPPDDVRYSDIVNAKPGALFYDFSSCSVGNFSEKENLMTAYVFEGDGLAARGFTTPIFGQSPFTDLQTSEEHRILAMGGRIFESYPRQSTETILGDPTLRIQPPRKEGCTLAFDRKSVDFGSVTLSFSGPGRFPLFRPFGSEEKILHMKNIGTGVCAVTVLGSRAGAGLGQMTRDGKVINIYGQAAHAIKPGEVIEFKVTVAIPGEFYFLNLDGDHLAIDGDLIFVSNDEHYLVRFPVTGKIYP